MLSRFSTVLQHAVDALAPPVPLHDDFLYHWKMVMKFYVNRSSISNVVIESTNIPAHLDQIIKILVEEEEVAGEGAPGTSLEYLLQHRLLELLASLAVADRPPGMRPATLRFLRQLLTQMKQPLLPHVAVYCPAQRLVAVCDGAQASPTEMDEIQFLCTLCAVVCKHPHLANVFNTKNVVNRRTSFGSNASSLSSGFEDLKLHTSPSDVSSETSSNGDTSDRLTSSQMSPTACGRHISSRLSHADSNYKVVSSEISQPTCDTQTSLGVPNGVVGDGLVLSQTSQSDTHASSGFPNSGEPPSLTSLSVESQASSNTSKCSTPEHHSTDRFSLLESLLSYFHSADSRVVVKACEAVMALAALPSDDVARLMCRSGLGEAVASRLDALYHSIPSDVDPSDVDDLQINWGYDAPPDTPFPGCRQVAGWLWWLDYADQLCREARPELGRAVAAAVRTHLLEGTLAVALQEEPGVAAARTSKLLRQVSAPVLQGECVDWLLGPLYLRLLELCNNPRDDISLETLRLFEVLVETCHPRALDQLLLSHLEASSNIQQLAAPVTESQDIRPSSPVTKAVVSRDINRVIDSFLSLLPPALRSAPNETGYQHYVADAERQFCAVLERCAHLDCSHRLPPPPDNLRPDADCDEGPFLHMLFSRLAALPYQPYEINLQLTGLVSRLALLPLPPLHNLLLTPRRAPSLIATLRQVASELTGKVSSLPGHRQALGDTRQRLLYDVDLPPVEHNTLFESLIVLEEFCKELAAIAFVKYHHTP